MLYALDDLAELVLAEVAPPSIQSSAAHHRRRGDIIKASPFFAVRLSDCHLLRSQVDFILVEHPSQLSLAEAGIGAGWSLMVLL